MKLFLKLYLWLSRDERHMRSRSYRRRKDHEAFMAEMDMRIKTMFKGICRDLDEAVRLLSR